MASVDYRVQKMALHCCDLFFFLIHSLTAKIFKCKSACESQPGDLFYKYGSKPPVVLAGPDRGDPAKQEGEQESAETLFFLEESAVSYNVSCGRAAFHQANAVPTFSFARYPKETHASRE